MSEIGREVRKEEKREVMVEREEEKKAEVAVGDGVSLMSADVIGRSV
jgi:hypothetical protein